jgi:hypothetical protein
MRKIDDRDVSPEVRDLIEKFAASMPDDHAFICVARRSESNRLYNKSSVAGDATTLIGLMDAMGGIFKEAARQIVVAIERLHGRHGR